MSQLFYSSSIGRLSLHNTVPAGPWAAANFVDSSAAGPFPSGTVPFIGWHHHPDDAPESPFGLYGIILFSVVGRTGMGIHSGRAGVPDALGREGIFHCTLGCLRTSDAAMAALARIHATDQIIALTVAP
jgi:hypothetical protein